MDGSEERSKGHIEELLRELEDYREKLDRFQVALHHIPITIFRQDRDLKYTWIHNLQVDIQPEQIIGKTDEDFVPPEYAARLKEIKTGVLESGKGINTEVAVIVMGERFIYNIIVNPLLDAEGAVTGITGVTWDITRRQETGEALRQANEEKYRTVADFTYDWEYWLNEDHSFNYVSPSCERITGYRSEDFLRDKNLLRNIIHPDDQAIVSTFAPHQFRSGKFCEMEFRILRKDGTERWIGHACQSIYGMNGEFLGKRGSNRDITEKVRTEKELLNVTFEVEERERNRFSRDLHDGLGPLFSTIKLYFQWLAETDDPDKIKMITEKGNKNIERAIQTTREVSHGLSSQYLADSGYVDAILNFTQLINDTEKITIHFTFNSRQRFSNLLELTLYRITTELINNTLNHASASKVLIRFTYHVEKKYIDFTFQDNGAGFDLHELERKGGGFGIKNMQKRIEVMRGTVKITTSPGKGVKVAIRIPVV